MTNASHAGPRRILVVEDNPEILLNVRLGLQRSGFDVTTAGDGRAALASFAAARPDLIVLDLLLPDIEGIDLCYRFREMEGPPIIMLTSLDSVSDRVEGLRAGADDYLVKPFAMAELVARIEAVLRRSAPNSSQIEYEDLVIDLDAHEVRREGEAVNLTPTEFELLVFLARRTNRVVTRQIISSAIWPLDDDVDDNLLDAHLANLRQKLEAGGGRRIIQTVRGIGFVLR
ncbi:MAG: response regulator transcription factor [Dehalococcoidia bacterium]|nr:response regulator transcription factor [Dehalococcoidia bacterium]